MDEKPKEKTGGISKIWNDYLSTTSAHSISHIPGSASTQGRLYWYALFLGVFAVACYQSLLLVQDYRTFPVLMNIRVINQPNLLFPSVTVCNHNRLMASKVAGTRFHDLPDIDKAFCACRYVGGLNPGGTRKKRSTAEACVDQSESGIRWDLLNEWQKRQYVDRFSKEYKAVEKEMKHADEHAVLHRLHTKLVEPLKRRVKRSHVVDAELAEADWIDYSKVNGTNDWWGLLNATTADNLALIGNLARATANETDYLGHQAEDFIVQCSFDNAPCSYRDFKKFQHKTYGNCYTFNHGTLGDELRYTSRSGTAYGLKLTLFLDQAEYIGLLTQGAGVRTVIHRPYTIPFPEDEGHDCRPGTATTLGIRQHEIHLTRYPYGGVDCTEGIDEAEPRVYGGSYSFLACTKACIQRRLLETCYCLDDINTLLTDVKICDIMIEREAECVNSVYRDFEDEKIFCECDQLCNETYYTAQYSATLWPSDQHEGYLYADIAAKSTKVAQALDSAEKTAKNVVRLNVHYMELNKQSLVEKKKYEIWDLLSSLGGSMGLYVGMSVVSIVEVIGVLLSILVYGMTRVGKSERRGDLTKRGAEVSTPGEEKFYEYLTNRDLLSDRMNKPAQGFIPRANTSANGMTAPNYNGKDHFRGGDFMPNSTIPIEC